jgi:hypothetical protein
MALVSLHKQNLLNTKCNKKGKKAFDHALLIDSYCLQYTKEAKFIPILYGFVVLLFR